MSGSTNPGGHRLCKTFAEMVRKCLFSCVRQGGLQAYTGTNGNALNKCNDEFWGRKLKTVSVLGIC